MKKIILLLTTCVFIFSCETDEPRANTTVSVDLFNADGNSINLSELSRRNPKFTTNHLGRPGTSSRDLLTSNQFRKVTLEIVSVEGSEPQESSIASLVEFINQRLNKPDGVSIIKKSIASPGFGTYSINQIIEDVEIPFRTQFNSGDNLSIFIFFADADNEDSSFDFGMSRVILGSAYFSTSFVIYQSTLKKLVNSEPSRLADVEAGTLRHEFAHLMGLVNIGTSMVVPHEDFQRDESGELITDNEGNPQGNGHCNVPNCLMEANSRLIRDMMGGIKVLDLDPLCIQDLQRNGGK